jgi:3-dehydroquinate synthase
VNGDAAQCIALIGPSGVGKSTVGQQLAYELGWPFFDLDALIEDRAGQSVSAIFASEGEAGFRERESAALSEALDQGPAVLACGGGAVVRLFNRNLLRERAWCVYLSSTAPTLISRIRADQANLRPLLADALEERVVVMLGERRPLYAALANWTVHTDTLTTQAVASEIVRGWRLCRRAAGTTVNVAGGTYQVKTGSYESLPDELARLGLTGHCWLISDTTVGPLYAGLVEQALSSAGLSHETYLVEAGESSKSLRSAEALYTWMLEHGVQRGDTVLALGGGVVGDLAGFAAATVLRGVAVVQLPTTILAMIDSSIGGKTGVNHPRGKNLIGAFHQPRLVLIDPLVLPSLPRRERAAGWAETVKHGVIADAALFADLERAGATLNDFPPQTADLLLRSAAVKIGVVNRDEREAGERMLLNYGHTMGQAIEAATGYTRYLHGEAVAIGMTFAAELAVRRGLWSAEAAARQRALLEALELPTALPSDLNIEQALAALNLDKKRAAGVVRWVLPTAIGRAFVDTHVPPSLVQELLEAQLRPALDASKP